MKTNKLAAVIRSIVREEVQKELKILLTERKNNKKQDPVSSKMSLSEALSQTETESYPTMKTFDGAEARSGFAAMQDGVGTSQAPVALEGHNGRVVDVSKVDASVTKAMTRDYTDLVKRFKK